MALATAIALAAPAPSSAQLSPAVHGVRAHDLFGGSRGVGVRLGLGVPLGFRLVGGGDWFFPSCDGRCRYRAANLDAHVPVLPLPVISPYILGGLTWRRYEGPGAEGVESERGVGAGLGLRAGVGGLGLYLETRYEFLSSERQWVSRLGVEF
jgi:hypothetical protein